MSEKQENNRLKYFDSMLTRLLLMLLSWGLLFLCFPWPNLYGFAYLALIPLTLAGLGDADAKKDKEHWELAFMRGSLFYALSYMAGAGWYLTAFHWLMHVAMIGWLGLGLFYALTFPLYLMLIRFLYFQWKLPVYLVLPVIWVGLESVRGVLMGELAVPMYLIGQSQPAIMIQSADLLGMYLTSLLIAFINGVLLHALLWWGQGHKKEKKAWLNLWPIPMTCLLILTNLGYGWFRLKETDAVLADAPLLKIAVIQSDIPQSNKENRSELERLDHIRQAIELSDQAITTDSEVALVIWPETLVGFPINRESAYLDTRYQDRRQSLANMAAKHQRNFVIGGHSFFWKEVEPGVYRRTSRRNSAFFFAADGVSAERYDKIHRVPFGEFLPFVDDLPILGQLMMKFTPYQETYNLEPGKQYVSGMDFEVGAENWRVAPPICFEDIVGYVCRKMVYDRSGEKRVDVLLNLSNDGWFPGTSEPWHHEQISRFRCVENRVPMARSVNRGASGVVDSGGRVVQRISVNGKSQLVSGYLIGEVRKDSRKTMASFIGDLLPNVLGFTVLFLLILMYFVQFWRWSSNRAASKKPDEAG